jgi:hypothetical protein
VERQKSGIIPLDHAHEILYAFGIGPESRGYQRWKKAQGFEQDDLETVMGESTHTVLGINWRAWLKDVIDDITNQLSALGFVVSSDLDDEGEKGILRINGTAIQVAYRPVDDGDFDPMIAAINRAIAPRARYRKFASCEGSDGWFYAVLTEETWRHLTTAAESSVNAIFRA